MYPATPQFYSFPTRRSSDLRSYRRGGTVLGEVVLDQPLAEVIAGSLREHLSGQQPRGRGHPAGQIRSEEHTSELQSLRHLVCRLLLEKKKKIHKTRMHDVSR